MPLSRRRRRRPVVPGSSLTYGQLRRESRAAVNTQYAPAQQQLRREGAELRGQEHRTQQYFQEYLDRVAQAQQQQQALTQAASGLVGQQADAADASASQNAQGYLGALQSDFAQRGATMDPAIAERASQASNVRRVLNDSFGAQLASQGVAQGQLHQGQTLSGEGARLQALAGLQGEQRNLGMDRRNLAREKGQARLQYQSQRKADELENVATMAIAGMENDLDRQKLRYDRRAERRDDRREDRRLDETVRHNQQSEAAARDRARDTGNGDDAFGNTPKQQRAVTSDFRKVKRNAKLLKDAKPDLTWREVYDAISPDYDNVDVDVLNGAIQQVVNGRVAPKLARRLRSAGVTRGFKTHRKKSGAEEYSSDPRGNA